MAVFDSRSNDRLTVDDTQVLECTIEAAENVQGHTVYIMRVHRGPFSDYSWHISRRYSDFDSLNSLLQCSGIDLPLPPKKVFGKLEREFIAERQQGLQNYINNVLNHPLLSATAGVKKFFDPDNYSFNYLESSLQHVSMVFRSEPRWEIMEPLPDFGWRIRKQYFFIKSKNDPKQRLILSWMSYGPDKYLTEKDLQSAIKLIAAMQHPFIYPIAFACVSDNGGLAIRDFLENGTLRDILCKTKPRGHFLRKYGKPKMYSTLEPKKIQIYGRQILLALKFLHDRGLPHGNLHSGNIVIENDVCKLLEVENFILGVPCFLRPFFVHLKKVQTVENIDIYCFGHLLYEMAFGSPLYSCTCNSFPSSCPPELRSVLEATLTKEACKNGLPSVSDLLQHPFFSAVASGNEEKVHFKVSSQLKENFRKAKEQMEQRLKEEQKVIRHNQRFSRVHAQITSEEEKKKRQNERKKQQKLNLEVPNPSENGPSPNPSTPGPAS